MLNELYLAYEACDNSQWVGVSPNRREDRSSNFFTGFIFTWRAPRGGWGMGGGGKSALMGEVSKNSWKRGSSRISTPSLKQNPKTPTQIRVNKHAMSLKICQKTPQKNQENWINSKNHRENKKTGSVKTIVLDRDLNIFIGLSPLDPPNVTHFSPFLGSSYYFT